MNEQNHEQRITDLEHDLAEAHQTTNAMLGLVGVLADFQKTATGMMYEWIIALETRNNKALDILGQSLTDAEARQKLKDILALNVFERDQLEAMLKKFNALRLPSSNPPTPPPAPGA